MSDFQARKVDADAAQAKAMTEAHTPTPRFDGADLQLPWVAKETPTGWEIQVERGGWLFEVQLNDRKDRAKETDENFIQSQEACIKWLVSAANSHARLLKEREELRAALEGVLADIRDYERVNNLLPNPGREDCWQSVTRARATLLTLKDKE